MIKMELQKSGREWLVLIKRTSTGNEVWQPFKTKRAAKEFINKQK
jgi:hypothetical protein